jgi:hypothetical protein
MQAFAQTLCNDLHKPDYPGWSPAGRIHASPKQWAIFQSLPEEIRTALVNRIVLDESIPDE